MHSWRSRIRTLISIGILSIPARSVFAQSAVAADSEIRAGITLREQALDVEALEAFRRAHALFPSARALAQMGLAEQALGQWRNAEIHLSAALQTANDPWIRRRRSALIRALAFVRSPHDQSDSSQATDAERLARADVTATAFTAADGGLRDRTRTRPTAAIAMTAAGSFLAFGTGIVAQVAHEQFVSASNSAACAGSISICTSQVASAQGAQIVAVASFAGAGALLVTAAVLFFRGREPSREMQSRIQCGPGPGLLGASCGARF